jgi:hypothetical protein
VAVRAIACASVLTIGCGSKTGLELPSLDGAQERRDASIDQYDDVSRRDRASIDSVDDASSIATALDGLRWELPCESTIRMGVCTTRAVRTVEATLSGQTGEQYAAVLRFRGVVEVKHYVGGTNDGAFWQIGGAPVSDSENVYSLTISSPPQQFFLNRATVDLFACFAIDYEETVLLDTGANVRLDASSNDGRELQNMDTSGNPIVVPGIVPAPRSFDGQFIQMDVVSLRRVR